MKAVVLTTCRLKSILPGGEVVEVLDSGEYFYGTPNATNTDLTGITHYYTSDGVRVELPKECKASIGVWIKTYLEDEPGTTPTPTGDIINIRKSNDGGITWYESKYYQEVVL